MCRRAAVIVRESAARRVLGGVVVKIPDSHLAINPLLLRFISIYYLIANQYNYLPAAKPCITYTIEVNSYNSSDDHSYY